MSTFLDGMKKKSKPVEEEGEKPASSGWMGTGHDNAERLAKRLAQQASESTFTPEWWVRVNEAGVVRFLDEGKSVRTILEHTIKSFKNGKERYTGYTCPVGHKKTKEERQAVCPLCRVNNWSPFKALYNVIDRRVWKDKKGKEHTNEVRVLKANWNLYCQLKEYEEQGGLLNRDIRIKRVEAPKGAVYTVVPLEPSPLSKADKALKRIDIEKAYAPKSIERLAALAGINNEE